MPENLEKRLKRQVHGKLHRFTAIVPLGFEATLVKEMRLIGITAENDAFETVDGKVSFSAKITDAWKALAHSRIANRVLMDIASFKAENFRDLEKKAVEIPWELYLPPVPVTPDTVPVHVTCKHSRLYHSDAVAERFYDVISESNTLLCHAPLDGASPIHSNITPQHLYISLLDDRCTVSLDLAGEELYKRGHQRFVNDAPLKETIAAAMLFEAFEQVQSPITLIDPMAGSGTFSLEAAYMASGLIPGKCRDFALKHQPTFKEATWNYLTRVIQSGEAAKDPVQNHDSSIIKILTSDISDKAIEIIRHNVECSPLAKIEPAPIAPQQKDFFSYTPEEIAKLRSESQAVIVLNPPYGKRLDADAPKLYARIGKKLSELAQGIGRPLVVAILAPKGACTENLLKNCVALGLASTKLIKTSHGGISLNCFIATI